MRSELSVSTSLLYTGARLAARRERPVLGGGTLLCFSPPFSTELLDELAEAFTRAFDAVPIEVGASHQNLVIRLFTNFPTGSWCRDPTDVERLDVPSPYQCLSEHQTHGACLRASAQPDSAPNTTLIARRLAEVRRTSIILIFLRTAKESTNGRFGRIAQIWSSRRVANPLELLEVEQIVPCVQSNQVRDALFAPLDMYANPSKIRI
jgi:hypothetical protein